MPQILIQRKNEYVFLLEISSFQKSILSELTHYKNNAVQDITKRIINDTRVEVSTEEALELLPILEGKKFFHTFGGDRFFYALLKIKYWDYEKNT